MTLSLYGRTLGSQPGLIFACNLVSRDMFWYNLSA